MSIEFSPPTNFSTGNNSTAVITADLNGDGNLDLVTNFANSNTQPNVSGKTGVSVLLGNGAGQFAAAQNYAIERSSPNPQYQQYQDYLQSFGASGASFSNPYSPTLINPVTVQTIATADVNRDGKVDIITAGTLNVIEPQGSFSISKQRSVISVLQGDGVGGFGPATNFLIDGVESAGSIAIADFNSDGNVDLASVHSGAYIVGSNPALRQQVSILSGDGSGSFVNERVLSVGQNTAGIVAADFNGDGRADLAISTSNLYSYDSGAGISVLLADGSGGFSAAGNFSAINSGSDLLVADFDGDNKLDIASSGGYLPGDGTGKFGTAVYGATSFQLAAGDFNGDGRVDFATDASGGYGPGGVSILLGNGTGHYSYPTMVTSGGTPRDIAVGDFNKDGKLDFATVGYSVSAAATVSIALNTTTSTDALVITNNVIDASSELSGALNLNLAKKTLQLGAINKPLGGTYRSVRGTALGDRITGSGEKEFLDGIAGNDVIVGLDGKDFLNGGQGNDILTGGKGKDTFAFVHDAFNYEVVAFNSSFGVDKIIDFTVKQDKIELRRDTFTALSKRISFASVETKKAAQKSKSLITYIEKTGSLYYNQNGVKAGFGSGGLFADLANGLALTAKDFSVI